MTGRIRQESSNGEVGNREGKRERNRQAGEGRESKDLGTRAREIHSHETMKPIAKRNFLFITGLGGFSLWAGEPKFLGLLIP